MKQTFAIAVDALVYAVAMLVLPGESPPAGEDHLQTICRRSLDPHDLFTRVVPAPS